MGTSLTKRYFYHSVCVCVFLSHAPGGMLFCYTVYCTGLNDSKMQRVFVCAGQKTCLHVHGVFPYIYVPYDGFGQEAERYLRQVAFSIDRAVNVSMGNPSSHTQHVFKITLVSGMYVHTYTHVAGINCYYIVIMIVKILSLSLSLAQAVLWILPS